METTRELPVRYTIGPAPCNDCEHGLRWAQTRETCAAFWSFVRGG